MTIEKIPGHFPDLLNYWTFHASGKPMYAHVKFYVRHGSVGFLQLKERSSA